MTRDVTAELLVLRKRAATWILMGIWTLLGIFFAYIVPYALDPEDSPGGLEQFLPGSLAGNLLEGFPFFGGVFALMLGVFVLGSEYGWGTLKTLFTQRPGRLRVLAAKLTALAIVLVPFVLALFVAGAVTSYVIAVIEDAPVNWPSAWLLLRAIAAGWLILAVWAALGVLLGVVTRGTSLAIGVGILYALVIEGLLSAFADSVSLLEPSPTSSCGRTGTRSPRRSAARSSRSSPAGQALSVDPSLTACRRWPYSSYSSPASSPSPGSCFDAATWHETPSRSARIRQRRVAHRLGGSRDKISAGFVLRINEDGSAPMNNPFWGIGQSFAGEAGENLKKVFAIGIRNSFGMAFDPVSGDLWEQENGDDTFDEINRVERGMNGGWVQLAGPIDRVAQFREMETTFGGRSLQQLRWPPTNIAETRARSSDGCCPRCRGALLRPGVLVEVGGAAGRHRLRATATDWAKTSPATCSSAARLRHRGRSPVPSSSTSTEECRRSEAGRPRGRQQRQKRHHREREPARGQKLRNCHRHPDGTRRASVRRLDQPGDDLRDLPALATNRGRRGESVPPTARKRAAPAPGPFARRARQPIALALRARGARRGRGRTRRRWRGRLAGGYRRGSLDAAPARVQSLASERAGLAAGSPGFESRSPWRPPYQAIRSRDSSQSRSALS